MGCTSCHDKPAENRYNFGGNEALPMMANDIEVIDQNEIRQFNAADWPEGKHKLLIFYPQTFTPVCMSELGAINQWLDAFAELNCVLIAACTDAADTIKDWYEGSSMGDQHCLTFSSYLLPSRLGLVDNGRVKRSSVFVMADGQVVKQEHFARVGRSFAELHRMLYGHSTGSYCAEGWTNPADGFLVAPKDA